MSGKEDCFHLGAKALIRNTQGQLLLLQKNAKKPHAVNERLWDLPGGRIQRNESLEEALKREVYEETGLQNIIQTDPFTIVLSNIRIPLQDHDVGLIFAVYLCSIQDDNAPIQLSDEHQRYIWVLPREAAEFLAANHPVELTKKISQLQMGSFGERYCLNDLDK